MAKHSWMSSTPLGAGANLARRLFYLSRQCGIASAPGGARRSLVIKAHFLRSKSMQHTWDQYEPDDGDTDVTWGS